MANVTNDGFNGKFNKYVNQMPKENVENFNPIINGRMVRPPLRTLYIHTVSKKSQTKKHLLFPALTLRGCENGERWVKCCSFSDPIVQVCPDDARGGNRVDEHDAWLAALDTLCPGNLTMDPYNGSENPTYPQNARGTNLICEGFFPSWNEVPTEAEIKRAEQERDRRYRWLTKEAFRLAAISTEQLNDFLQRVPDVHIAMDALGLSASWHAKNEVKATCPNCGDEIKQGIAFHQSSAGVLCIIDPEKAWKAGAIKKDRYLELVTAPTV